MPLKQLFRLIVCLWLLPETTFAERAASPADATVFIRVMGDLRLEYERFGTKESIEKRDTEIITGSGFVISPYGYVVTSHHVVSGGTSIEEIQGIEVQVTRQVARIEVVFPAARTGSGSGALLSRYRASVAASDPELDLAVLFIAGADLPYLPLGDSDAVELGQSIEILGYPFGRAIDIALGNPRASDVEPAVSVSRGLVSAFRAGERGERRHIQVDARLHPGNSGGPMVDREGYALGIAEMQLTRRGQEIGIGFAIPINRVKQFIEAQGLDQALPARRLRLGPSQTLEGKGLRLRLPEGRRDISRARVRVDIGGNPDEVTLRIDRVASSWSLEQIEQALLAGQAFERFTVTRRARRIGNAGVILGYASGTLPDGSQDLKMEYSLVDLGRETLVTRYLGHAEQVAFNQAVLRASLADLEVQPLLTRELDRLVEAQWSVVDVGYSRAPLISVPAGWVQEPGAPFACPGLPPADFSLSASPVGDFTVVFRLAWWPAAEAEAERAVAACSARTGPLGHAAYASREDVLGTASSVEGVFVQLEVGGLLQLEVISPVAKLDVVGELFAAWIREASR